MQTTLSCKPRIRTYLTLEEIDRLRHTTQIPESKRLLFLFAIYTGLRRGELWNLTWQNVHLKEASPWLSIPHSSRIPTKQTWRVTLLPEAKQILEMWRPLCLTPNTWVFPSSQGTRRNLWDDAGWGDRRIFPSGIRPGYKTIAGIARPIRFHDLRRTHHRIVAKEPHGA